MNKTHEPKLAYCVATPEGRGAVATMIIHGPEATERVAGLFRSTQNRPITSYDYGQIVYGSWLHDGRDGEDLVVCCDSADHLEVHCHGGSTAIELIAESLRRIGVSAVGQNEMAARIHGHPYWADLEMAVTKAPTTKTALWLLRQSEAHVDFWVNLTQATERSDHDDVEKLIQDFLQWQTFGAHLTRPWSIVFCGLPNVGKSSLINALLGYQRAIVHDTAGTTRDVVSAQTALEGWPIEMWDTAGLRDTHDHIEQQGIEQAHSSILKADVVVHVIDASQETDDITPLQIQDVEFDCVVANKADLGIQAHPKDVDFHLSAKTGLNLEPFIEHLVRLLIPQLPPSDQAIPVSRQQIQTVDKILNLVRARKWPMSHSVASSILSSRIPALPSN